MTTYELRFHSKALREWRRLDVSAKEQLKRKLGERLQRPKVLPDRLRGPHERYKIKLKASGFRLVYQVFDDYLLVLIVAHRDDVYKSLRNR